MPDHLPRIIPRLLISLAVGVVMAATVYWNAYSMRGNRNYRRLHQETYRRLGFLKTELDRYYEENGKYPANLVDLKTINQDNFSARDDSYWLQDPWHQPFQYQSDGKRYSLSSFGPDCKRGGEGLHEDLDVTHLAPDGSLKPGSEMVGSPTMKQFTFEVDKGDALWVCALAGACAFLACMAAQKPGPAPLVPRIVGLVVTLAACIFVTSILSALHIPSGH